VLVIGIGRAHPEPLGQESHQTGNNMLGSPLDSISLASDEGVRREASSRQWNLIFWATVAVLALVLISCAILKHFKPDQFIYLARSFAHGRLSVDEMPLNYPDYVIWRGHVYLPPGPLPAVLLIPFLPLIDLGMQPEWISILFTLINIWLLYKVLGKAGILGDRQRWALLLFFGGTVYFSVAATMTSWYFGHIVATFCLLLALQETLGRRRALLVGLLVGLAAATRLSLVFALPFFLWWLWFAPDNTLISRRMRPRNTLVMMLGLAIPMTMLLAYNYARFGNALETGYGIDVVGSWELQQARSYGLFSIVHIPRNLHFLILQGPLPYPSLESPTLEFPFIQPSPMGMSIFLTSPALLLAFRTKWSGPLVKACWLAVAFILIPLLTHYATGWIQFGFRYSLDLMLFLVLITSLGFPVTLGNRTRILIMLSVLINLWGTSWLQHWL
jgi:hypothetical protein